MRRRKAAGFGGAEPLEWPDFDAFIRVSRVPLNAFEIELIEVLDDAWLTEARRTPEASPVDPEKVKDSAKAMGKRDRPPALR